MKEKGFNDDDDDDSINSSTISSNDDDNNNTLSMSAQEWKWYLQDNYGYANEKKEAKEEEDNEPSLVTAPKEAEENSSNDKRQHSFTIDRLPINASINNLPSFYNNINEENNSNNDVDDDDNDDVEESTMLLEGLQWLHLCSTYDLVTLKQILLSKQKTETQLQTKLSCIEKLFNQSKQKLISFVNDTLFIATSSDSVPAINNEELIDTLLASSSKVEENNDEDNSNINSSNNVIGTSTKAAVVEREINKVIQNELRPFLIEHVNSVIKDNIIISKTNSSSPSLIMKDAFTYYKKFLSDREQQTKEEENTPQPLPLLSSLIDETTGDDEQVRNCETIEKLIVELNQLEYFLKGRLFDIDHSNKNKSRFLFMTTTTMSALVGVDGKEETPELIQTYLDHTKDKISKLQLYHKQYWILGSNNNNDDDNKRMKSFMKILKKMIGNVNALENQQQLLQKNEIGPIQNTIHTIQDVEIKYCTTCITNMKNYLEKQIQHIINNDDTKHKKNKKKVVLPINARIKLS